MDSDRRKHNRNRNVVSDTFVETPQPIISLPDEKPRSQSTTWEVMTVPGNHAEHGHYEDIILNSGASVKKGVQFGSNSADVTGYQMLPAPPPLPSRINQQPQEQQTTVIRRINNTTPPNSYVTPKTMDDDEVRVSNVYENSVDGRFVLVKSTKLEDTYLHPVTPAVERTSVQPEPSYLDEDISPGLAFRYISRKRRETVFINVTFLKVGEIRTKHEDFSADVFIQAKWREKKLDKKKWKADFELRDSEKYWNPEIMVENSVGDVRESVWHVVTYEKSGHAYICEKRRIKGIFSERMELRQYPFDTQSFTVTLMSNRRESEVLLERDPGSIDDVSILTFVDEQEWSLHKSTQVMSQYATFTIKQATYKRPKLSIAMKATRKASYFMLNIVMVMVFICSLIFTTFGVRYTLIQNRLQLSFILMLSNVTFKKVVSDTLPKVSYMTYLDHYVMWQTTIMFLVSIWHAVVFQIQNHDYAELADKIAFGVFGGVYIIVNIVFFTIWGITVYRQRRFNLFEFIN